VAIYVQHKNNTKFIDFQGIAAGVSLDVYLLTLVICLLLLILFALIDRLENATQGKSRSCSSAFQYK
jgi:hypothetical protein